MAREVVHGGGGEFEHQRRPEIADPENEFSVGAEPRRAEESENVVSGDGNGGGFLLVVLETVREKLGDKRLLFFESSSIEGRSAGKLFDEIPVTDKPAINEAGEALRAAGDCHVFYFWSSH